MCLELLLSILKKLDLLKHKFYDCIEVVRSGLHMYKTDSNKLNNEKQLLSHKNSLMDMQKDLSFKHKQVKDLVSDLYYEVNKKSFLLEDETIEDSQRSMLKYDFTLTKRELEKAIFEKELLCKDLNILQTRLKTIENEIIKSKPWWYRYFRPI